jgi:hypothetical protein
MALRARPAPHGMCPEHTRCRCPQRRLRGPRRAPQGVPRRRTMDRASSIEGGAEGLKTVRSLNTLASIETPENWRMKSVPILYRSIFRNIINCISLSGAGARRARTSRYAGRAAHAPCAPANPFGPDRPERAPAGAALDQGDGVEVWLPGDRELLGHAVETEFELEGELGQQLRDAGVGAGEQVGDDRTKVALARVGQGRRLGAARGSRWGRGRTTPRRGQEGAGRARSRRAARRARAFPDATRGGRAGARPRRAAAGPLGAPRPTRRS